VSYATFTALSGVHAAVYSGAPETAITASPAAATTITSASFSFTATPAAGATFQCALDGVAFAACTSPRSYTGLAIGAHTFQVRGANLAGTDPTPANFTWTVASPDTTITASPAATTASSTASFSFIATPAAGATFQCALDAAAFAACTSPRNYTGIGIGSHTFQVRAVGATGTDATPASFTWTMNGLVAAFGFEETTGTTTEDSSGTGNTGTLANATRATVGKIGHALSFNGTNAWVTIADANSLDLTTAMTIEAWVNPATLTNWRMIVMKEGPAAGLSYSLYANDVNNRPGTFIRTGASDVGRTGTAALALNTWTHVAATYDDTTLRLYVNGTLVSSGPIPGGPILASAGVLRIGGNAIWGEYFSGMIDEVRIYSRVLTAAQIAIDMTTPIKP
jgi:Concanavalin A-like lectin/glucanases superfamily